MAQFLRELENGQQIYETVSVETERKAVDPEQGVYEAMITAEVRDRDGDIVRAAGVHLDNFRNNPVVLFAHNDHDLPVARSLEERVLPGKGIVARFQFPPPGTSARADEIHRLWAAGYLNAVSIRFMPIKYEDLETEDEQDEYRGAGKDFQEWELIEYSIVPLPANQDALRQALKILSDVPASKSEDEISFEVLGDIEKFAGSPRNPYGTHSSYKFKGGQTGYKAAWRCHFSQVGGGSTSAAAMGPIRGTVRRVAMIAAAMNPACQITSSDSISARTGPKSPLKCSYPGSPGDYGLSAWKKPETDEEREGVKLSCSDLNVIKRAATAEIKRRIQDREGDRSFAIEEIMESDWSEANVNPDDELSGEDNELNDEELQRLATALLTTIENLKEVLT